MTSGPVVFLDIGASLIDGPPQAPARFLAARLSLDDAARKRLNRLLLTTAIEQPADLAALLTGAFGVDHAAAGPAATAVWTTQVDGPAVIDGARALLSGLRDRGVRYGFISNIWHPYAQSFQRLFGPLAASDLTLLSYRLGVAKPDAGLYEAALAQASCDGGGRDGGACVMIGDTYDNDIAPARRLGLRTVWLLHRPDKEKAAVDAVEAGALPAPDLTVPAIGALTVDDILGLFNPVKKW